jgi:acyl carrier protein
MERKELLHQFEALLERPTGSLTGTEELETLEEWDSMSMMGFIALAAEHTGANLSPRQFASCRTVNDLLNLTGIPQS